MADTKRVQHVASLNNPGPCLACGETTNHSLLVQNPTRPDLSDHVAWVCPACWRDEARRDTARRRIAQAAESNAVAKRFTDAENGRRTLDLGLGVRVTTGIRSTTLDQVIARARTTKRALV